MSGGIRAGIRVAVNDAAFVEFLQYDAPVLIAIAIPVGYLVQRAKTAATISCVVLNRADGDTGRINFLFLAHIQ